MSTLVLDIEREQRLGNLETEFNRLRSLVRAHIDYASDAVHDKYTEVLNTSALLIEGDPHEMSEQAEELAWGQVVAGMRAVHATIERLLRAEYDLHQAASHKILPHGAAMRQMRIEKAVRRNILFGPRHR